MIRTFRNLLDFWRWWSESLGIHKVFEDDDQNPLGIHKVFEDDDQNPQEFIRFLKMMIKIPRNS